MKFTTIAIIKPDEKSLEEIKNNLTKQSKEYVSEDMKILTTALLEDQISDIKDADIAVAISEMNGTETGVDEKGVYEMVCKFKEDLKESSSRNIEQTIEKLDFCDNFDVFDVRMTDDLLNDIDSYERFPDSLITTDGQLSRAPQTFFHVEKGSTSYKAFLDWEAELKKILEKYSGDTYCLMLSCHV